MKVAIMLVGALMALCGCSMTLPVEGQSTDGLETFTGKATGYADGSGSLSLVSNKGLSCSGNFVYVTPRTGSGTFTCSNGQSGPFNFVSTGTRGSGTGKIGDRSFTFAFG
jgi:hypothetical protein